MDLTEKLSSLGQNHKKLLQEYEALLKEYQSLDFINDNTRLKADLQEQKKSLMDLEQKYNKLYAEHQDLRLALKEQILDEKLNILKISRNKLETYFKSVSSEYTNSLTHLEQKTKKQLDNIRSTAGEKLVREKEEFLEKINYLSRQLAENIRLQQEEFHKDLKEAREVLGAGIDHLATEEISQELITKRARQNEIEMKIGLNWINKMGIILILLGVGAAAKYTYSTWFNDHMKGIFFFLLGGLFLAAGEWFYRKTKGVFATGLLGGGISILYGAVFYSYFLLNIVSLNTGLFLSVMVTLTAVVLSLRYNSKTICSLGLVGGYLPFFSYLFAFGLRGDSIYAAMGYLFLLNLSILIISYRKKWVVVSYISFLFNVPSLVYLVLKAPAESIGILYSIVTFSMYLLITLAYPLSKKIGLKKQDVILLGLNTFFSCLIIYGLFEKAGLSSFRGALALTFCLVYAGLGQFINKIMRQEKSTIILFYTTSLTFAVLMIPFQFGVKWLSMGWLVEGSLLIIYGCKNRLKNMELSGWTIFGLCLAAFYLFDCAWLLDHRKGGGYFDFKYLSVIAGMLVVLFQYLGGIKKGEIELFGQTRRNIQSFKYFTLANLWIYLLYTGTMLYDKWMPHNYHYDFYRLMTVAFICILLGFAISKIPLLYDKIVNYFSTILYVLGDMLCIYITLSIPVLKPLYANNTAYEYLALALLIAYNVFVFFSVRDITLSILRERSLSLEIFPLFMSIYLLGNISSIAIVQFRLGGNLLFSNLFLLVAAFSCIFYGFKQKFIYIRRFGLGLALITTSKLFIYDLSYLNTARKIVAYFCFGLVLLGISFIYQKMKNSMEGNDVDSKM